MENFPVGLEWSGRRKASRALPGKAVLWKEGRKPRGLPTKLPRCWQRHTWQLTLPTRLFWKLWKPRAYPSAEEWYWFARSAGTEDQRLGG